MKRLLALVCLFAATTSWAGGLGFFGGGGGGSAFDASVDLDLTATGGSTGDPDLSVAGYAKFAGTVEVDGLLDVDAGLTMANGQVATMETLRAIDSDGLTVRGATGEATLFRISDASQARIVVSTTAGGDALEITLTDTVPGVGTSTATLTSDYNAWAHVILDKSFACTELDASTIGDGVDGTNAFTIADTGVATVTAGLTLSNGADITIATDGGSDIGASGKEVGTLWVKTIDNAAADISLAANLSCGGNATASVFDASVGVKGPYLMSESTTNGVYSVQVQNDSNSGIYTFADKSFQYRVDGTQVFGVGPTGIATLTGGALTDTITALSNAGVTVRGYTGDADLFQIADASVERVAWTTTALAAAVVETVTDGTGSDTLTYDQSGALGRWTWTGSGAFNRGSAGASAGTMLALQDGIETGGADTSGRFYVFSNGTEADSDVKLGFWDSDEQTYRYFGWDEGNSAFYAAVNLRIEADILGQAIAGATSLAATNYFTASSNGARTYSGYGIGVGLGTTAQTGNVLSFADIGAAFVDPGASVGGIEYDNDTETFGLLADDSATDYANLTVGNVNMGNAGNATTVLTVLDNTGTGTLTYDTQGALAPWTFSKPGAFVTTSAGKMLSLQDSVETGGADTSGRFYVYSNGTESDSDVMLGFWDSDDQAYRTCGWDEGQAGFTFNALLVGYVGINTGGNGSGLHIGSGTPNKPAIFFVDSEGTNYPGANKGLLEYEKDADTFFFYSGTATRPILSAGAFESAGPLILTTTAATIAAESIAVTNRIGAVAITATGTLTTITGGTQGQLLTVSPQANGVTVTITDSAARTANTLHIAAAWAGDKVSDSITFKHNGVWWDEWSRADCE